MQAFQILKTIPSLVEKTFPIPGKFRRNLPSDIAELSSLLTNKRGDRSLSYLARPNLLSAYLYYFMPWNIYRLIILLNNVDFKLQEGSVITDLGCGPLTFTSALWIARPDLRDVRLEINCIDRCSPALEAGKNFFTALCESAGEKSLWKINLVKQDIDLRKNKTVSGNKASLVCAVNLFNEIYESISHNNTEGLRRIAASAAQIMHNQAAEDALVLTSEPGIPQSGKFISFLREAFMELGHSPLSPCTHSAACPLCGREKRWCHFAFDTADVPKELSRLSKAAGIPKERLVFSYLLTANKEKKAAAQRENVRVISDAFPVSNNRFGRYGCCEKGLVLLTGEKNTMEKSSSLSLVASGAVSGIRDKKSGACIMEIQ